MILKETVILGFVTLLLGIGVGALFDKLIYAFLQRHRDGPSYSLGWRVRG